MSSIAPTTIQYIQQMGTATEKLQHSLQNIPNAVGQQYKEERKTSDEIKRTTIQDAEESKQSNTVHQDGSRRKQARKKDINGPADDEETTSTIKRKSPVWENGPGKTINLIV